MALQQASFHCPQCNQQRLFTRQGTSHVLHLLLTLFLCGLWLPIWILIAISDGNAPYFCSQCGYAGTPRALANPMQTRQRIIQAQRQAEQRALEPALLEKVQASPTFKWAIHPDNLTKVVAGTVTAVIIGFIGIALIVESNNRPTQSNALPIPSPTYTPQNFSNYLPPPIASVTPIQRTKKVTKVKKKPTPDDTITEHLEFDSNLADVSPNENIPTDESVAEKSTKTTSSNNISPRANSSDKLPTETTTKTTSSGYYLGPRGGCYTYTSGGKKRYVDRSLCH